MSDDRPGGTENPEGAAPGAEQLGSVAEEAAKLFEALQGWAKENGAHQAAGGTSGLGAKVAEVNEHIATGGEECTCCPVCQAIQLVRQTSPEVRSHLTVAARSLLHAAAGLLDSKVPDDSRRHAGVEKIDLDDTEDTDDERPGGWDAD